MDSYDFRTRNGAVMKQNVLSQLQKKGKGIILFHDIQRSTAAGIADLLDELKRRKFKVVHMIPKAPLATVAAYDAIAQKDLARRKVQTANNPLASRSMTWPVETGAGSGPAPVTVARPPSQQLPWKPAAGTAAAPPARNADAAAPQAARNATPASRAERPAWKREELPWQEQMWNHYR